MIAKMDTEMNVLPAIITWFALGLSACSSAGTASKSDAEYRNEVARGVHEELVAGLSDLVVASNEVKNAAPVPSGRGWDENADAPALAAMRDAWHRARSAYERVEGAIAPLFPDIDASIDARYEDFLVRLGPSGDSNLFDGIGVTGMHAVERILFANTTPLDVVEFESTLPGYAPAFIPRSDSEAAQFKNELCAKFVSDAEELRDTWQMANNFDLAGAFTGLIDLMREQLEKVDKASTSEEESRYAQNTMRDIRDNLAGTQAVYAHFQPWLRSKQSAADATDSGSELDRRIIAGFAAIGNLYSAVPGDAMPRPPADFSHEQRTEDSLATPFGALYWGVHDAVDVNRPESVVSEMNRAAALLGLGVNPGVP
jgi:iron uptake system component EfeO